MSLMQPVRPIFEKKIDTDTVYVFIRQNLELRLQMLHVGHAIENRVRLNNEIGHPILQIIGVPSEERLMKAFDFISVELGYKCYKWIDPSEPNRGSLSFCTEPLSALQKRGIFKYRIWNEANTKVI